MSDPVVAFIGLGANLGPVVDTFEAVLDEIAALPETTLVDRSSLYRSVPIDAVGPDFINAVARVETRLSPHELLQALQAIEHAHGRVRSTRNSPRTLDLDLLIHGDVVSDDIRLQLPHPRLHERAFVLKPLMEIAPDLVLEGHGAVAGLVEAVATQRVDRLDR